MNLHWDLKVKFRIWGITLGTVNESGDVPIPVPPLPVAIDKVLYNDRGVYLHIKVG